MSVDWLMERMAEFGDDPALIWSDRAYDYASFRDELERHRAGLDATGVRAGEVVALHGDYSPAACALMLALIDRGCVAVPLTSAVAAEANEFREIAQVQVVARLDGDDRVSFERIDRTAEHEHYRTLRERGVSGLVLFSSGSTGKSKAAVHDFSRLLDKFQLRKQRLRTLTFLLLDHIGGINTLFYTLSNGGTVVVARDHTPAAVCDAIERHRVELLPTSPTFLNLLLLSGELERHDLSSLRLVTYGTEPMPESTLQRIADALPDVRLQQTYGLSELGILRSKSRDNKSLWVKIGGEGFETRVVDGILHIRAHSAMLGYLNAPSPFDAEGWMNTQDEVEQDGDWFRIKGRQSEIINVGGQKVYPAEVESVIGLCENVKDVTVRGESHPITGQVVTCRVNLVKEEEPRAFRKRLRAFSREHLASFKVPVKVQITADEQFSARHKRMRK
jgi:acyl-coenzyme A synthetase/AMP-(fatty) acid ligase